MGRFARPRMQVEWKVLYIVCNEEPTRLVTFAMVTSYTHFLEEMGHIIMPRVSPFVSFSFRLITAYRINNKWL